jgi:hypothetical protein
VIVRQSAAGEQLSVTRIDNDPIGLAEEIGKAGECPEVVLKATYAWPFFLDFVRAHGPLLTGAPRVWDAGDMQKRSRCRAMQPRALWAAVAGFGQVHWFFGNVYEAVVDMPQLLADAQQNREPRLLGAGSPLRYYIPTAPVTLVATAAALIDSWRSGGDRRVITTAAASTASAAALTAYLVRTVNLRLLRGGKPVSATECRRLVRSWHRGNLVRLLVLAVAAWALRQAAQTADSEVNR